MKIEDLNKGTLLHKDICDVQVKLNLLKLMKETGYYDFSINYRNKHDVYMQIDTNDKDLEAKLINMIEERLKDKLNDLKKQFEKL